MIIKTQPELISFCERLQQATTVCIDTEFAREGRYFAELGIIQVAAGTELAVIDAVAVRDLSCLKGFLVDPDITKVFHAGEQDLEILYRLIGCPVTPVFDTQIAAAFLGYGDQISLRSLLQAVLGVQIAKEQTFTDWLRRPLSSGQMEYALNDVRYLERVYQSLKESLRAAGRLDWVCQEFKSLESAERLLPDERKAYLKVGGAARLNQHALGLLQELAAWRESAARRLNLPVRRIVMDPVLTTLAVRPPSAVDQLDRVRGLNAGQVRQFGAGMIEALRRGVHNTPPPMERAESFPSELEGTVDFLSLCMRSVAREHSISTGVLANRHELRMLAALGEAADTPLLRGWRREMLGTALLSALQGKVTAGIDPATKEVHLQWPGCSSEEDSCVPAAEAAGEPSLGVLAD